MQPADPKLKPKPKILIIDDDPQMRKFLSNATARMGMEAVTAENGQEGVALYAEQGFDLVLSDIMMTGMDGIEVIQQIRSRDATANVIVMTGYSSIETAVQAMKAGAIDYLLKPLDVNHLEIVLGKALEQRRQAEKLHYLEEQVEHQGSFEGLVGVSAEMQSVYGLIRRLSASDATVLVQGETGTGKEVAARAIHNLSQRRQNRFVPINCGALSDALLESELFGHEKGAFTGAFRRKHGLIEQAEGGTLFLDEIEEMSPSLQVKLLRTIQEREILPVGGERPTKVDFRLVAATNVDLGVRMEQGKFRLDLFYRLSVTHIDLPALRTRRRDIPLLANHFLDIYTKRENRILRGIAPETMMLLKAYAWPGNVRELENVIQQVVLLCDREEVSTRDLPSHIGQTGSEVLSAGWTGLPLKEFLDRCECRYLEGNRSDGLEQ